MTYLNSYFENMKKIKVIIVDDSASIRASLKKMLSKIDNVEVVATAPDAYVARDKIILLDPDVIILDIEMPRMDGLTFLEKLMKKYPKPVVIFSSLSTKGSETALRALELGAVEVVSKSDLNIMNTSSDEFIERFKQIIYTAYRANIKKQDHLKASLSYHREKIKVLDKIIVIGASTGGTEAIKNILSKLPKKFPPIIIVQHMPPYFTKRFAERLDEFCHLKVWEAEDNELIAPGQVFVAPGNYHVLIEERNSKYYISLSSGPRINFQRPSVDILFKSAARTLKDKAIGILLTGMGKDGAKGLLEMKEAGAVTIAQDKTSCTIYGMSEEAVRLGAADYELDLFDIPEKMIDLLK